MNNKDILNEGFFNKKKSYAEKEAEKFPQYNRVGAGGNPTQGYTSVDSKDIDELKKRLTGGLGVIMGGNNIRTMAQKSIKTFPIIVSEDVDASTALMIKNMLEIRYAELLNQIISNQIIDITQFDKDSDKNIAIQAVDKIIGSEDSNANKAYRGKLSVDDIAGNTPLFSLFRQESVNYGDDSTNAILENALVIDSKNVDKVVEVLKEAYDEKDYQTLRTTYINSRNNASALQANYDKLKHEIEEDTEKMNAEKDATKKQNMQSAIANKKRQLEDIQRNLNAANKVRDDDEHEMIRVRELIDRLADNDSIYTNKNMRDITSARDDGHNAANAFKRGVVGLDQDGYEKVEKLLSSDVVLDKKLLDKAINKNIADVLNSNEYLKDRFEKATYLLQSSLISGMEYADYLKHLGIPVRKEVERDLLINFPMSEVDFGTVYEPVKSSTAKDKYGKFVKDQLDFNKDKAYERALRQKKVLKVVGNITSAPAKDIAKASAIGAAGAGAGAGITLGVLALLGTVLSGGAAAGIIAGGAAIGGGIGLLFKKLKANKSPKIKAAYERYEGWQRVEELIQQMDDNTFALSVAAQKEIFKHGDMKNGISDKARAIATAEYYGKEKKYFSPNEVNKDLADAGKYSYEASAYIAPTAKEVSDFRKAMARTYNESVSVAPLRREDVIQFTEAEKRYNLHVLRTLAEGFDYEAARKEILTERVKVSTTTPVQLINKNINYNDALNSLVPTFGTKDVVGYGSVEFDRRDLKNRRFMQPLVMTVRFKERYADGKFADNELTAVIGVLGVITYVPTEEMKYILSSNAAGKGLSGFITADSNNKNSLGDLLAGIKGKLDYSKLKQSADVWNDLEKVSEMALANKLAGKSTSNLANTHIIFSTREVDDVRRDSGVDYLRDMKSAAGLMKRYSAMTLMVANDTLERVYMLDDINARSWVVVPYSEFRGKDSGEQLAATIANSLR